MPAAYSAGVHRTAHKTSNVRGGLTLRIAACFSICTKNFRMALGKHGPAVLCFRVFGRLEKELATRFGAAACCVSKGPLPIHRLEGTRARRKPDGSGLIRRRARDARPRADKKAISPRRASEQPRLPLGAPRRAPLQYPQRYARRRAAAGHCRDVRSAASSPPGCGRAACQ